MKGYPLLVQRRPAMAHRVVPSLLLVALVLLASLGALPVVVRADGPPIAISSQSPQVRPVGGSIQLAASPAAAYTIFLPALQQSPNVPPQPPPQQPPPPPPPPAGDRAGMWLPYTASDGTLRHTYGATVGVDPAGGIHVAYAIYIGEDEGRRPITYAYCATGCANRANWSFTRLDIDAQDVRLVLNPAGRPRLMVYSQALGEDSFRKLYQYAICDTGCTNAARWSFTTIVAPWQIGGSREHDNNRYFALDSQGRPAFVYTDNTGEHVGTFYAACAAANAADCTDTSNWYEIHLLNRALNTPSLVFSPTDQPRIMMNGLDQESNNFVWYIQCDSDCADGGNWSGIKLMTAHGSAIQSLQVDSQGRPRVAFYSGSYASQPFEAGLLYYLWCDSACSTPEASWSFNSLGLPFLYGDSVDLRLDAQGRPRMAYEEGFKGLGYTWCNEKCESDSPRWQSAEVESSDALANDYDILPIRRCSVSAWANGVRPSLAFDAQGQPRIAYDAQHWWYGTEIVTGVPHICNYKDINVTRVALFPHP